MNINKIKEIVNNPFLSTEEMKNRILDDIASDDKALLTLMLILQKEREQKQELLLQTNRHLSKALVILNMQKEGSKQRKFIKEQIVFTVDAIKEHYLRWKDRIKCCFQIKDIP